MMASIEFAIDAKGHKVQANNAQGSLFKCSYCLDKVILRGVTEGSTRRYFAHRSIPNRTPLEKLCPGYTGGDATYSQMDEQDKIIIENGGVPLYLLQMGEQFELRACFPQLSENTLDILEKSKVEICVNPSSVSKEHKLYSDAHLLKYYKVHKIERWIDVECNVKVSSEELQRKWLCGIKGLDLDNDIYHANQNGGYRLANRANVSVNKPYRIISSRESTSVNGISFCKIGNIYLYTNKRVPIRFSVHEMRITVITDSAREFIESKGYRLIEFTNKLIPVWPPAAFEGKNLNYNCNVTEAWFVHLDTSQAATQHSASIELIKAKTSAPYLIIPEQKGDRIKEIVYNMNSVGQLKEKNPRYLQISIRDSRQNIVDFNQSLIERPHNGPLWIESTTPFLAIVQNGTYTVSTSKRCFEHIREGYSYTINSFAYGILTYCFPATALSAGDQVVEVQELYRRLSKYSVPLQQITFADIGLLQKLLLKINRSDARLQRLVRSWISRGEAPYEAIAQVYRIYKSFGGQ